VPPQESQVSKMRVTSSSDAAPVDALPARSDGLAGTMKTGPYDDPARRRSVRSLAFNLSGGSRYVKRCSRSAADASLVQIIVVL